MLYMSGETGFERGAQADVTYGDYFLASGYSKRALLSSRLTERVCSDGAETEGSAYQGGGMR